MLCGLNIGKCKQKHFLNMIHHYIQYILCNLDKETHANVNFHCPICISNSFSQQNNTHWLSLPIELSIKKNLS